MAQDFNLLRYVNINDPTLPTTAGEREAYEQRRKMMFNEMQYQAHLEQEHRKRERTEKGVSGRQVFPQKDRMHHYSNFWFGQGTIPTAHAIVGRAPQPAADAPVVHTLDDSLGQHVSPGRSPRQQLQQQAFEFMQHAPSIEHRPNDEPQIVLRPKTPPPSPASVVQRQANSGDSSARRHASPIPGSGPTPVTPPHPNSPFVGGRSRGVFNPSLYLPPHAMESAPFAMHYTANALWADGVNPGPHVDKNGVLRGQGGVDDIEGALRASQALAGDMRRRAEYDRKVQSQRQLKEELDGMIELKEQRKAQERSADDFETYGVSLPLGVTSPRSRIEMQRRQREELQRAWSVQASSHRARQEAERQRTAPDTSMWWLNRMDADRERKQQELDTRNDPKTSWKRAWQEHQQAVGDAAKREQETAARIEEQTLGVNVANYADRIILSELQRREAQREYQRQLDEQVHEREFNRKSLIAENYDRERRFNRGPFTQYKNSFH